MKVKAKHRVNYNGVWYKGGDVFTVDDYETVKEYADKIEEAFVSEVFPPIDETPKKRGRQKKD